MSRKIIPLVAILATVSMLMLPAIPSDAETTVSGEYWCYGDMLHLEYGVVGTSAVVTWDVSPVGGTPQSFTGDSLDFDATAYSEIYVTQTVTISDRSVSQTILIHMVHIPAGSQAYAVIFLKEKGGTEILGLVEFDENTIIRTGSDGRARFIADMPEVPEKEGYVFQGWFYTDSSGEHRFNEFIPIVSNMEVYAKWVPEGGSDPEIVVVDRVNIVTFQVSDGLRYHVSAVGKDSIRFSVSAMDGYTLEESTLSVTADAGELSGSYKDGFVLENIDSSILVTISGDAEPSEPPEPGIIVVEEIPLWVWILIAVLMLIIVVVVVRYYRRG